MKNPSINAIYIGFLFILTFFSGSASTDTGNPSKQPLTSNTSFNIVEANPKPNSLTAPRQPEISIKFNDVINRNTVSDTSIVVYGNQTGFLKCKAANYTFAQNDSIVEFISDRQFNYGEIVSITLTTKLESATGVPLSRGVVWSFTIATHDTISAGANFTIDSTYRFGSENRGISTANINGDNFLDLLVTSEGYNTLYVFHGDGKGGFSLADSEPVGAGPFAVVACDLNEDERPDAAVANKTASTVSILRNNAGTLAVTKSIPVGNHPKHIAATDLNADGHLDIITANEGDNSISIIYNRGGFAFDSAINIQVCKGDGPAFVCARDFDGDQRIDLAVANSYERNGKSISLFPGTDTGYAVCNNIVTGLHTEAICAAILDHYDSIPHIVTAFDTSNIPYIVAYKYDDSIWSPDREWMCGTYIRFILSGDFDADSSEEIIASDYNDSNIYYIDPSYTDSVIAFYCKAPEKYGLCSGDFNGDGDLDLALANYKYSSSVIAGMTVLLNRGPYCEANSVTDTAQLRTAFTLTTTLPQCSADSVFLHYRKGGSSNYSRMKMDSIGQYIYESIIPAESITVRGIDYYFVACYQGDSTTSPLRNPENRPFHLHVRLPNVTLPPLTLGDEYQMVGFPLEIASNANTPQAVFEDDMGPQDNWVWRCGHWDPLQKQIIEYPNFGNIAAGRGYWIASRIKQYVDASGYSSIPDLYDTASGLEYHTIHLQTGWNQIANPFCFPILWEARWDTTGRITTILKYEAPGFNLAAPILQPYCGYFVFSDSDNAILGLPYSEASNHQRIFQDTLQRGPSTDWLLSLTLVSNGKIDDLNLIGAMEGADDRVDRYDIYEPPYIGQYISLSTIRMRDNDTLFLMKDLCRPRADLYEIPLHVRGNTDSPAYLSMKQLVGNSDSLAILLYDPETKHYYDPMSSQPLVLPHLPSESGTRYVLVVGTKSCIPISEDDISTIPSTYTLYQNVPNPFNQSTIIQYSLPIPQHVTLSIYNVTGQTVKILDDRAMPAGTHRTTWDGTGTDGNYVSSGIYFYQIVAGDFRETRKLTLVK